MLFSFFVFLEIITNCYRLFFQLAPLAEGSWNLLDESLIINK